jgi:hypothetical protein
MLSLTLHRNSNFSGGSIGDATPSLEESGLLPFTELMQVLKRISLPSGRLFNYRQAAGSTTRTVISDAPHTEEVEISTLEELTKQFNERADRWERETAILSSPSAMYLHRDYMSIIGKGIESPENIAPLILERISARHGDWFFALEQIAGKDMAENCEKYEDAVTAWYEWAKQKGYVKERDALLRP